MATAILGNRSGCLLAVAVPWGYPGLGLVGIFPVCILRNLTNLITMGGMLLLGLVLEVLLGLVLGLLLDS